MSKLNFYQLTHFLLIELKNRQKLSFTTKDLSLCTLMNNAHLLPNTISQNNFFHLQKKALTVSNTSELASFIWSIWPDPNVRARPAPQASDLKRRPRSTYRYPPSETSSRLSSTARALTCHTEIPNWLGCCKIHSVGTQRRWCLPTLARPSTTTMSR